MDSSEDEPSANTQCSDTSVLPLKNKELTTSLRQCTKSVEADSLENECHSLGYSNNADACSDKAALFDKVQMYRANKARRSALKVQERLDFLRMQSNSEHISSAEGQMMTTGDFVAAYLTESGGNLSIPGRVTSMFMPPGALQEMQIVYLYSLPPSISSGPVLDDGETWLTPIVECGLTGLKFCKKVFLTIPHCISSGKWKYTVHWATHDQDGEQWHRIQHGSIFEANGAFIIATDHFTRYGVSGSKEEDNEQGGAASSREVESKWMKPVVCVQPIANNAEQYEVRVQVCNIEDAQNLDPAATGTKQPNPSKTTLCVQNTAEDISITLTAKDKDAMVIGESKQVIPFQSVWSKYLQEKVNGGPLVIFTVQVPQCSGELAQKDFAPTFVLALHQGENRAAAVSLQVQPTLEVKNTGREPSVQQEDDREERFLSRQPYYNAADETTLKFLNDASFRKLCVILDGNNRNGIGWEALAPKLKFKGYYSIVAIQNIACGERKSPSVLVLDDFFKDNKDSDSLQTLQILSNALGEVGNHDAKDLVEEEIFKLIDENNNLSKEMGETTEMNKLAETPTEKEELVKKVTDSNTSPCKMNPDVTKSNLEEDNITPTSNGTPDNFKDQLTMETESNTKTYAIAMVWGLQHLAQPRAVSDETDVQVRTKNRLEALAAEINNWEDDTNHPVHKRQEMIRVAGHASSFDVKSAEDIKRLSIKQLKEMLSQNFVDYRGCVERYELEERATRLFYEKQKCKEDGAAEDSHELNQEICCRICMDASIDCVLLNCGHMVTCCKCGSRLAECPICRQNVVKVVRVFKS